MHRSIIAEPTHRRIGGDISSGVCIMLSAWAEHAEKLKAGEITKEDLRSLAVYLPRDGGPAHQGGT